MVRYIDITQSEYNGVEVSSFGMTARSYEGLLEISFFGIEWEDNGKQIPNTTTLTIKLFERYKNPNTLVPFKQKWTKDFLDVSVPTGVWNGVKLGQLTGDKIFIALGASVAELNVQNGDILWTRQYANTSIDFIRITPRKDLYVLYSSYRFKSEAITSNLIKINNQGNLIWSAQTKVADDVFDFFNFIDNRLHAYTWNGWSLELDNETGQIIDAQWTK